MYILIFTLFIGNCLGQVTMPPGPPGMTGPPSMPGAPGMPGLPGMPGSGSLPSGPDMPTVPTMPNMPTMPNNTGGGMGPSNNTERPCDVFDIECIRRYFVKHAKCKEVRGYVPDPYFRPQTRAFLTNINLTLDLDDVMYRGLNGRIEEFFIDRQTDKLVLAVRFRNLYTASDCTYFRFHRRAREPIITMDYLRVLYRSLIVTIIIPEVKNLQLKRGETFTFVNDAFPRVSIGPRAFDSSDPTVRSVQSQFYTNMPISVREAFLTEGSWIIATFIQKTICDFGLTLL